MKWVMLAKQTSGVWFNPNEWSSTGAGKFAILDKLEQFRCVQAFKFAVLF
jgi:hypothetical protein